jgi:hypothetical protein
MDDCALASFFASFLLCDALGEDEQEEEEKVVVRDGGARERGEKGG